MTLGRRIKEARKRKKLSQEALAKAVGSLTRNAVSLWEKDTTRPSTAHLLKLANILDFDPLSENEQDGAAISRAIPLLSWVPAGKLADIDSVEKWGDFSRVAVAGLEPGDWIALRVEGTSMDRIAPAGSIIVVNRADRELINGRYYVFRTDEGITFKQFRTNPERLEPVSTFADHQTIFPEGQVKVIGRVRKILADY